MNKLQFQSFVYRMYVVLGWVTVAFSFVYIDRMNLPTQSALYRPQDILLFSYISFLFAHKIKYAKATYDTHKTSLRTHETILIFLCFIGLMAMDQWTPQAQCMTFMAMVFAWNVLLLVDERYYLKHTTS